jgi:hypothetical protein
MADEDPNLDLPELDEKEGFPWIIMLVIVVVIAIAAALIYCGKSAQGGRAIAIAALDQQLTNDSAALEEERNKIFDMTHQLESMKYQLSVGGVKDRKKAVEDYNKLAAEQRAQRDKVKAMSDAYNQKVSQLHELQQ